MSGGLHSIEYKAIDDDLSIVNPFFDGMLLPQLLSKILSPFTTIPMVHFQKLEEEPMVALAVRRRWKSEMCLSIYAPFQLLNLQMNKSEGLLIRLSYAKYH